MLAGALVALLSACGIDGAPAAPEPNEWPQPGAGLDVSPVTGVGIGSSDNDLYGLSI